MKPVRSERSSISPTEMTPTLPLWLCQSLPRERCRIDFWSGGDILMLTFGWRLPCEQLSSRQRRYSQFWRRMRLLRLKHPSGPKHPRVIWGHMQPEHHRPHTPPGPLPQVDNGSPGLDVTAPDGSTKTVRAVPCGTAAHETDGFTTCVGIADQTQKRHRR